MRILTVTASTSKKSWPVLVMAACSLIPFLGIFAGFIAVCWGLVTDRPRGILAAGLGAAGMVLNLGGMALIGYSVLSKDPRSGGVMATLARTELDTLAAHIEAYKETTGRYPTDLSTLARLQPRFRPLPNFDHSVSLFNVSTHYLYRLTKNGDGYTVFGAGPDGVADTPDDIFPTAAAGVIDVADSTPPDTAVEQPN